MKKVNLKDKLSLFSDHWNPRIVGELNNQHVKLAKLKGEFIMHKHEAEDEMFLVLNGKLKMVFVDHEQIIQKGEFIIIPKGTLHQPIAESEVEVLLFEPTTTLNTGDISNNLTKENLEEL